MFHCSNHYQKAFEANFASPYSTTHNAMVKTRALKILIIDDNLTDANQIGNMLAKYCQSDIKLVSKIKDAISSINHHQFDAILFNLFLSDNQKKSTLEQGLTKVQKKAPNLPIIVITAAYDASIAVQCLRRGAQDYLTKNELTETTLIRSIQYAIERQRIEFNERQQALMKKMVDKIRNSIDLETILKTTVQEIQQFLDVDQVLIYRYESNRLEDISVVSSSLDSKSATHTVAKFISASDLTSHNLIKPQSICIKVVEDTAASHPQECSNSSPEIATSYLRLPIYFGKSQDLAYKDLTHPIIQQDEIVEPSEQVWGMLIAYNTNFPRKWQDWEINFLQKLTTQVTIAIQQSQLWYRLQTANEKLQQLAILDGLTSIYNRRYFDLVLDNEWKRSMREQQPLSLIICDVDHFKAYNDTYGHQQGDKCLKQIAKILQKHTRRSTDFVARYGGEEFAIILPNTDTQGVLYIANKIKQQLAKQKLPHRKSSVSKFVTCSMGGATMIPSSGSSVANLIADADKLLYQAKHLGRDRIVVEQPKKLSNQSANTQ